MQDEVLADSPVLHTEEPGSTCLVLACATPRFFHPFMRITLALQKHVLAWLQIPGVQTQRPRNMTYEEVAAAFAYTFDKFQSQALEKFLAGLSVVVCAPTASGKTAIAEAAAIAVLAR